MGVEVAVAEPGYDGLVHGQSVLHQHVGQQLLGHRPGQGDTLERIGDPVGLRKADGDDQLAPPSVDLPQDQDRRRIGKVEIDTDGLEGPHRYFLIPTLSTMPTAAKVAMVEDPP
jgi:hypothetical protein